MKYLIHYNNEKKLPIDIPSPPKIRYRVLNIRDTIPDLEDSEIRTKIGPITESPGTKDTILIAVSDITRKTGFCDFFPILLHEWEAKGIKKENISIIFATGIHRAPTEDDMISIIGHEIYPSFKERIYINNANNKAEFNFYGNTSNDTPVYINKLIERFSFFLITGTIKYHYFAGFGGGRKTILPGLAYSETIAKNHSLSIDYDNYTFKKNVSIGNIHNNIVALDMQEASDKIKIHGAINTIINSKGKIVDIFAGDTSDVFEKGVKRAEDIYAVQINEKADIVIAIGSNYKNLLQTHKALYNAHSAMKEGGFKIIVSPCMEGIGSDSYHKWVKFKEINRIIDNLKKEPDINGQTALSTLMKADNTWFFTEISENILSDFNFNKTANIQKTLDDIISEITKKNDSAPLIYIMPQAGETIPLYM